MPFAACYAPHAAAHEPTSIVKRCTLDLKKNYICLHSTAREAPALHN